MTNKAHNENYKLTDEQIDNILHDVFFRIAEEARAGRDAKEESCSILSPKAIQNMAECEHALRQIVHGDNVSIVVKPVESISDYGCIRVLGHHIRIEDPQLFRLILERADVFEFLPKTDGNVEIDLSFFNMTQEVKK